MPPLFRITAGTKVAYAMSDAHRDELLETEFKGKKTDITRFKGLGEMPYVHLRETTMDKKTRTLLQVKVRQDRDETKSAVDRLMGNQARSPLRLHPGKRSVRDRPRYLEALPASATAYLYLCLPLALRERAA